MKTSQWICRLPKPSPWGTIFVAAASTFASYLLPFGPWFGSEAALGIVLAFPLALIGLHQLFGAWRRRPITVKVGGDGLVVGTDFVPWSEVMDFVQEPEGVRIVCRERRLPVLDLLDVEGFEAAGREALDAYRSAPPPPKIEALRVRVETTEERAARLAALRGSVAGYRGSNPDSVDLEALEALLRNPTTSPELREEALRLLTRLDVSRVELARDDVEAMLGRKSETKA